MNEKKITTLCVHKDANKKKTLGVLHIHTLLNANIILNDAKKNYTIFILLLIILLLI